MVYAKSMKASRKQKHLRSIICVLIASLIMSINIKTFVRAGNLLPGGVTGLSLLLQRIGLEFFNINLPYSFVNIGLNAIPVYIGFKTIGKKFTSYSVLMIILNSFLVDIIPNIAITSSGIGLLVAVFGGIFNGLSISIALAGNASSGGTDFIAVYLSNKLDNFFMEFSLGCQHVTFSKFWYFIWI